MDSCPAGSAKGVICLFFFFFELAMLVLLLCSL